MLALILHAGPHRRGIGGLPRGGQRHAQARGIGGLLARGWTPFVIAAALKTAQGSSTVALITTSAIVYPLLGSLGLATPMGAVLATMAVGCGAMVVSHANDSYFWVVSQFSDLKVNLAYKCHSMATLVQGLVGILVVYILKLILV